MGDLRQIICGERGFTMANSNLAVLCNNMIFKATAPTSPSDALIKKLAVTEHDVTIVVDSVNEIIPVVNRKSPVLFDYIGELDFFNEAIGLACYCSKNGMYTYDCRHNHHAGEYPKYTNIMLTDFSETLVDVDIIIDTHDMVVYRMHRR